jgi:hypothetical protein
MEFASAQQLQTFVCARTVPAIFCPVKLHLLLAFAERHPKMVEIQGLI